MQAVSLAERDEWCDAEISLGELPNAEVVVSELKKNPVVRIAHDGVVKSNG